MRKLLLLVLCFTAAASPAFSWGITRYVVDMSVQRDSGVWVTESITVDFADELRHGIFRDIPLSGRDSWGNKYRIRFDGLTVTDQSGVIQQTKLSRQGGKAHIRIGDPNVTVSGVRTYVIRYHLLRAVHFFKDHDEIYWNAIGDEWPVPIADASARVTVPQTSGQVKAQVYTGTYGSTGSEAEITYPDVGTANFAMMRVLNPNEGMTVVVGWPKGVVSPPSLLLDVWWFAVDNGYLFLPILFAAFLIYLWNAAGRDPRAGRSETVMYDPPDGITPAEIGALIDERVDMRDISATIVDLAVRGYIHIKSEQEQGFLHTKTNYELTIQKPAESLKGNTELSHYEKSLIDAIFDGGRTRDMSDLKYKFYRDLPNLRDAIYASLVKRGYFAGSPASVRSAYLSAGVVLAVAGLGIALVTWGTMIISPGWGIAIAVCGGMLAAISRSMPKKTRKGKDALVGARGFEEYLSRAERGMIEMQERQGYFEKFLPYAMAFGIADRWARAFDGIQTTPPNWYSGADHFRPSIFAYQMVAASHNWGDSLAAKPRSSGSGSGSSFFSGGSGFSGGFSGGGGGGGGGGAW